jgi:hypothetical protein
VRYCIARQWSLRGRAGKALHYCLHGWRSEPTAANSRRALRTLARCTLHLLSPRSCDIAPG